MPSKLNVLRLMLDDSPNLVGTVTPSMTTGVFSFIIGQISHFSSAGTAAAMREASNRSPQEELSKYWSAIKKSTPSATSTEASSAMEFNPTATPRPPEAFPEPLKVIVIN
ncbi:hypothetical protein PRIPAC_86814 [Pristionchus pacificus]|uniref:Uncharacterized protein n=1 Tax=Pristionchus pacificus TaxID=54126 RepID=A0A2A6BUH8_PRIPA|nr:hypothetical protein PRIPAC_86814 [Pristionchus pacificus]|eukprot:PDM69528.1 hypothetical protein PRIPAC_44624 [Pristionchus pacificus]